ncbi:hypothetical protein HOO69_15655 (plasmid) [Vibrio europaeus]|uniref:Haemolysin-type calcium binding-related domain-containing protein n=1 Tax=Vibrio europaeus TaxID=300876 RepID=A0AAE7AZP6_9VIBR|nr:calcium-binding protein [Vibrio europaeus]QJY38021.1 hypothetical protein HOO69_15655 [Vibrio europaeus]
MNAGSGNDVVRGGEGNDTLHGGTGNDRLVGGLGAERYEFSRGDGHDTIRDRDVYGTSVDQIVLGEGNHMVLLIGGAESGDSITIENAYTASHFRIEEVVLSDGSKVSPLALPDYVDPVIETNLLVQAMSAFDTQESVANNAVIDGVTSSLSPNVVVSGQSQL